MSKLMSGFLWGALVGAAAAIILAPQSGQELQALLRQRWNDIMEEGQRAAAERRAELEAQFAAAKRAPRTV